MPLPVGTYTNCKIYVNEQIIACESITIARGQVRSLSITTNSHGQLRNIRSLGDNRYMVNGQKFIDLGLESGLLWAECNIGATRDKLSGNFYAWGETETKTSYTIDNAKWQQTEYTAGTTLTAEDDVATVLYGTAVHIPTRADFNELSNLKRICYSEYDDAERTNLYFFKMTSKLDSSQELYLPLSGVMDGTSLSSKNIEGDYWTSEPCSTLTYEYRTAYYLLGMKTKNGSSAWTPGSFDIEPVPLYRGLNIRPVTYK